MSNPEKSVVVLISGSGSNLQAILDDSTHRDTYKVTGVISNRPEAFGLERAERFGVETAVIEHKHFPERDQFDQALINQIDSWQPDLVVLAGFMRILTPGFVSHYSGRLMNIHPSLLPKYKGLNTHQRALDSGDAEHGCTVHFVTEELDAGYPIIQAATAIEAQDTPETLAQKIHVLEHQIYPLAVNWFCSGRIRQTAEGARLDDELLGPSGFRFQP